jgi:hypothetical protein
MANDEAFGTLDFQSHNTISDAENELLQQLLLTPSNLPSNDSLHDAQIKKANLQNDGRAFHDIITSNIPPDIQSFDDIPLPPIHDHELDSDVEDEPHPEPEPQFLQQRDTVEATDPVPESRYNL